MAREKRKWIINRTAERKYKYAVKDKPGGKVLFTTADEEEAEAWIEAYCSEHEDITEMPVLTRTLTK